MKIVFKNMKRTLNASLKGEQYDRNKKCRMLFSNDK